MNTKVKVILAVLLAMSTQGMACTIFGNVIADYTGFGASDSMTIWGGNLTNYNTSAGALIINKTGGTGECVYLDNCKLGVFCIDLLETIQGGSINYNIIDTADGPINSSCNTAMGDAKASYLSELWGRYYDNAWISGNYTSSQKAAAEAFQAAIWEIVYENLPTTPAYWDVTVDGTLGTGGFKATNLNSTLANNMLRSLNGTGAMADLRVLSYNGSQDFITAVSVPEPATIAFAMLGLVMMAKRNNKELKC
ncbi:MAG: hypothetical protein A2Y12_11695 [Planctomycetes bacterium GWF2_42_9]|nr:MAG: hypothetical protein A2Y12_11695 [Planctomycetes bacterium GWF2_42_9]HAL45355.1 hypothetical protein [Phycisphaerales bacterium]